MLVNNIPFTLEGETTSTTTSQYDYETTTTIQSIVSPGINI